MPNNLDVFWSILISRIQVYKTPVLLSAWGNSIWGKGRKEFILTLSVAIFSRFRLYLVGPYPFSLGSLFTPVFVLILRPPVQSLFICISYTFLEKNRKSAGRRVRHRDKEISYPCKVPMKLILADFVFLSSFSFYSLIYICFLTMYAFHIHFQKRIESLLFEATIASQNQM